MLQKIFIVSGIGTGKIFIHAKEGIFNQAGAASPDTSGHLYTTSYMDILITKLMGLWPWLRSLNTWRATCAKGK